jgi:hypothetical protein
LDLSDVNPVKNDPEKFRYQGKSMRSTFSTGQVLYIRPQENRAERGDVMVYRKGGRYVVHRVDGMYPQGYRMRGDDNLSEDAGIVSPDEVIGVVDEVDDWGRVLRVRGGKPALYRAQLRWHLNSLLNRLRPVLGAPYRLLKTSGLVRHFWHPRLTHIQVCSSTGVMVKFLARGKTVAVWQPESGRFTCRRPYDLVISPPK